MLSNADRRAITRPIAKRKRMAPKVTTRTCTHGCVYAVPGPVKRRRA